MLELINIKSNGTVINMFGIALKAEAILDDMNRKYKGLGRHRPNLTQADLLRILACTFELMSIHEMSIEEGLAGVGERPSDLFSWMESLLADASFIADSQLEVDWFEDTRKQLNYEPDDYKVFDRSGGGKFYFGFNVGEICREMNLS